MKCQHCDREFCGERWRKHYSVDGWTETICGGVIDEVRMEYWCQTHRLIGFRRQSAKKRWRKDAV